jgi:NarL family two-component system response regulator LiaR
MRGPKATQIELTSRQRAELERIIRKGNSKQMHVKRARIILLAEEGMSNQQIADQLALAVGTVRVHVSNILSKLHLADRTQAAVFAWREGIVRRD